MLDQLIIDILNDLVRREARPMLVGGSVRDRLIEREPEEYDIEVFDLSFGDLDEILYQHTHKDPSVSVTANGKNLTNLDFNNWTVNVIADFTEKVTIIAYDAAGNSQTVSRTYTLHKTDKVNTGGSSGGGGGGSSGEAFENIKLTETDREYVNKNNPVSFKYKLDGNIIVYINFTGNTSSGTIASKVEILNNPSSLVDSLPPYTVYKHVNIWVGNYGWATDQNIADPYIVFKVKKDWISENDIEENSVSLFRYNEGQWKKLTTERLSNDVEYVYYRSDTPGFSPFAISGIEKGAPEVISATPTSTPQLAETATMEPKEDEEESKNGVLMLLLFVGICGIGVMGYLRKEMILEWIGQRRQ